MNRIEACPYFPSSRRYQVGLPDPSGHDLDRVMKVMVDVRAAKNWPEEKSMVEAI